MITTKEVSKSYCDLKDTLLRDARRLANDQPSTFRTEADRQSAQQLARELRAELNRRGIRV